MASRRTGGKNLSDVGSISLTTRWRQVVRDAVLRHDLDDRLLDRQPEWINLLVVVEHSMVRSS